MLTRDAKHVPMVNEHGVELRSSTNETVTVRYSKLCQEVINITAKASNSIEMYEMAMKGFHNVLRKVEAAMSNTTFLNVLNNVVESGNNNKVGEGCLGITRPLLDPLLMKHKGRPKRIISWIDKLQAKKIDATKKKQQDPKNLIIEFKALIHGFNLALELGVSKLLVYIDSLLIVHHYSEQYKKNGKMVEYATLITDRMSKFTKAALDYLLRGENIHVNFLAYLAWILGTEALYLQIEVMSTPSIDLYSVCTINTGGNKVEDDDWRKHFIAYLGPKNKSDRPLPANPKERRQLIKSSKRYTVQNSHSYCRSVAGPYLKYLSKKTADGMLKELRKGTYCSHVVGWSLTRRIIIQGVFESGMRKQAEEYSQRCGTCQRHGHMIRAPALKLHASKVFWTVI
ncbi:hypothetical protein GIB67_018212 [Kingdonia uniflora]|uniref:RNase H type-1 domain-containing protein n=1 Tax=Kingdonia uniflora TaxID=39325 RepID=A0A7J7NN47_9MAGN|nr:hypothetical protein GIB67_018212 [Kingdonia uniflora]